MTTSARLGRYELTERLATGRLSEVFLANSHGLEGFRRTVVVKRLRAPLVDSPEALAQYLRQARRLFSLSHVNVVQVLDLGEAEGAWYLTEEHVEGYDLATLREMARAGSLTLSAPLGLWILAEAVKGVEYGHRRLDASTLEPLHLCHGDLHPRNLLLGFEGQVKLNDFGIFPPAGSWSPETDPEVARAWAYAAPEVTRGDAPTQISDYFALGLLAVEFCAGRHPYRSRSAAKVRRLSREGTVEPALVEAVPGPLRGFVSAALRPDPQERRLDLGVFYDRIVSYLHEQHPDVGPAMLARFVHDVGDVDLRTAIVDDGIIQTEHSTRLQVVSGGPGLSAADAPDASALWTSSAEHRAVAPSRLQVPLPGPHVAPLGINGRDEPLQRILGEVRRTRNECRAILVSSGRGLGKSHLLGEAWRALREDDVNAALVRCDRDAHARPWGAILDVLSGRLLGQPLFWLERPAAALLEALESRSLGDAESREIAAHLIHLHAGRPRERAAVRQALTRLLHDLVEQEGGRPLVVLLDGAERADTLSLELLHAVLGANRPAPMLLVAASVSRGVLNQLGRAGTEQRRLSLVLPPLDAESLHVILERVGGTPPLQAHLDAAGGSPQWAIAVGLAQRFGVFEGRRPERVNDLLGSLGEPHVSLLFALATADLPVPAAQLAAALHEETEEVEAACRELGAIHLLDVAPDGAWRLGPRALEEDCGRLLTEPRRDRIRMALAHTALRLHGGESALDLPFRARLLAKALVRDRSLAAGRQHVERLNRHGYLDVSLSYLDALAALADGPDVGAPAEALALRLEQVQLALESQRLERGRQILARLPARAEQIGNEAAQLEVLAQQARVALRLGQIDAVQHDLRRLAAVVDDCTAAEAQALTRLALSEWYHERGELERARDLCLSAWAILDAAAPHSALRSEVALRLSHLLVRRGERRLVERLSQTLCAGPEAECVFRDRARGLAALLDGDAASAARALETAVRGIRRAGRSAAALAMLPELVEACVEAGDLDGAQRHLEEGLVQVGRLNDPRGRERLERLAVWLHAARQPHERAPAQALEAAADDARGKGDLEAELEAAWLLWRLTKRGEAAPAVAERVLALARRAGDHARQVRIERSLGAS